MSADRVPFRIPSFKSVDAHRQKRLAPTERPAQDKKPRNDSSSAVGNQSPMLTQDASVASSSSSSSVVTANISLTSSSNTFAPASKLVYPRTTTTTKTTSGTSSIKQYASISSTNQRTNASLNTTGTNKTVASTATSSLTSSSTTVNTSRCIFHSPRQRMNPVLRMMKNFVLIDKEIMTDFQFNDRISALFLSMQYHLLNPNYIVNRLMTTRNKFPLLILLTVVDVEDCTKTVDQLVRIAMVNNATLILAWSLAEAARYLEIFKAYENKSTEIIQERLSEIHFDRVCLRTVTDLFSKSILNFFSKAVETLTAIRSVNKTDATNLLTKFGSIAEIMNVSIEAMLLCPGLGEKKVRRLKNVFNRPFKRVKSSKL